MTESRQTSLPAYRRLPEVTPKPVAVRELSSRSRPVPSSERRNSATREALVCRVRSEYEEMRGLRLTLPQARRLFALREDVCVRILEALSDEGLSCKPLTASIGGRKLRDD